MTSEKAVAVHRTSGGLPTTGAPGRSDRGLSPRTAHDHERIDPAIPSGPVDAPLGVRAAASLDVTDLRHGTARAPIGTRRPDPWSWIRDPLELDGRGDGPDIS